MQKVGLFEDEAIGERSADLDRGSELNFTDARRGARGFLDEEARPYMSELSDRE